ncbi:MAG: 4,5-DOPA dioxygenase extradiol [Clostridiales bacterium]|nr:4,5-DOPA dioxygenase extradiol [Clostridiales bacterium]
MNKKMPVLFVGHGSPINAIEDNTYSRAWSALGTTLERPKAVLSVSAHWFTRGTKVNDSPAPSMVYDMYGFPEELYEVKYPAPGSVEIAHRAKELLGDFVTIDNNWGLDHGTWSVLRRVFPKADVPVVQLSVNALLSPAEHFALGEKLRPLREEGVLIFGSGNIVHNLSRVDWRMTDGQLWAQEFDQYIHRAVTSRRFDDVVEYGRAGEAAQLAVPSLDHYAPLLYVLGASDENDEISSFNTDCTLASMSMTSYLFAEAKA